MWHIFAMLNHLSRNFSQLFCLIRSPRLFLSTKTLSVQPTFVALRTCANSEEIVFTNGVPVMQFKLINIQIPFLDLFADSVLEQPSLRSIPLLKKSKASFVGFDVSSEYSPRFFVFKKAFALEKNKFLFVHYKTVLRFFVLFI